MNYKDESVTKNLQTGGSENWNKLQELFCLCFHVHMYNPKRQVYLWFNFTNQYSDVYFTFYILVWFIYFFCWFCFYDKKKLGSAANQIYINQMNEKLVGTIVNTEIFTNNIVKMELLLTLWVIQYALLSNKKLKKTKMHDDFLQCKKLFL